MKISVSDKKLRKICKAVSVMCALFQVLNIFAYVDHTYLKLGEYIWWDIVWFVSVFWLLLFVCVNTGLIKPKHK